LEAAKLLVGVLEDGAPRRVFAAFRGSVDSESPELGFSAREAAELPVRTDEDVDEPALFGRCGLKS